MEGILEKSFNFNFLSGNPNSKLTLIQPCSHVSMIMLSKICNLIHVIYTLLCDSIHNDNILLEVIKSYNTMTL